MQTVEIVVRNNVYKVSCEDAKREHLLYLVSRFDNLVDTILQKTGGKGSDALNFLLAALTLEDQVLELTQQLNTVNKEYTEYKHKKKIECIEVLGKVEKILASLGSQLT
ncbi:hypothetical protein BIY23_01950 [Wolbachia pipientis]|uniref:Cell division protein ZapA n=1 Tax=Wolbachia pipientis TaxID=955 RepID=A0A1E7QK46_WOLPI|nr:cell division protein ZapA [Wolbachia pipientis]OEY86777.1 hypothetical protein BIY23_01950 [Wolbachia pipientis]